MMPRYSIFALLILLGISVSCTTKEQFASTIAYPHPLPDSIPLSFMPNVVSSQGLDFNAAFSPDGKSFFFSRSNNGQWDIYVSRHNGARWSNPILASFSDSKFSEADPAFSPDGKLYFISNRPKQLGDSLSDFDIWFIEPIDTGAWTEPENFARINSDSAEYYISFSTNGNVYFGSSRAGGFGAEDIYRSRLVNGQYSVPENLGPAINSPESDHDPCIWPNEELLIFKSENRGNSYGQADLYVSRSMPANQWTQAVNLGDKFNTETYEYCPYLTPDQKYFFFSSELDVKWIDANFLESYVAKLNVD